MGIPIEEIVRTWGYDSAGCWHEKEAEATPIPEDAEPQNEESAAPAPDDVLNPLPPRH